MSIDVYDFFSGCGGTSAGFAQAGLNIKMGLDIDGNAANTFRKNFPQAQFIESDIRELSPQSISDLLNSRDKPVLFSGCAPCQPFSKQNRQTKAQDSRINLLAEFGKFISYWIPDYIFVENVPGIQKGALNSDVFRCFLTLLDEMGYHVDVGVVEAQWYGVPQKRSRLVLLGSIHSPISLPARTHGTKDICYSTVADWISSLPPLDSGESDPNDEDHFALKLSPLNLQRIRATPEGGGRESWPDELILDCHKGYTGHSDVYGRLSWHKPAVGLTTKCISYSNGRFGHPTQDRALSLREAACLQTFPRSFSFSGSKQSRARQVGNAVPPLMAEHVARQLLSSLE